MVFTQTEASMSSTNHPPVAVIACKVIQNAPEDMLAERLLQHTRFMDHGPHRSQALMTRTLQEAVDRIEPAGNYFGNRKGE
jgi:hypothetical protein